MSLKKFGAKDPMRDYGKSWLIAFFCRRFCSHGLNSVDAVRPLLLNGDSDAMTAALKKSGAHRFPVARPRYIVTTKLTSTVAWRFASVCAVFQTRLNAVIGWLRRNKSKDSGYKEASHFLRNIGVKGHAILDKHVMRCLAEVRVIDSGKPPSTRKKYLEVEQQLVRFARIIGIDFDELDLVLWSMKTGEILK